MALYYELPVYRDTYQLILKIFAYTKDFSKEYKYMLDADMKRDALVLVRSIYRANKTKDKAQHLEAEKILTDVDKDAYSLLGDIGDTQGRNRSKSTSKIKLEGKKSYDDVIKSHKKSTLQRDTQLYSRWASDYDPN